MSLFSNVTDSTNKILADYELILERKGKHDDMVIDTSRVPIWAGLAQPAITAGIPRPSDIADIEDNKNNAFGNPWWTHSAVNRGGRGGGLPAMRATGKRWWALGQVDFVYIPPAPYPAQFIADLKLYLEKRVFSEIAVATAIHSAWTTLLLGQPPYAQPGENEQRMSR